MLDNYTPLLGFLEQNNFFKAAKVLKQEIELHEKNMIGNPNPDAKKTIYKLISTAIQSNSQQNEIKNKTKESNAPSKGGKPSNVKLLSQEETETIMEKFMNRLVAKPNLLEDESLNARIEKFFDNPTFQRMVETTDVFQDISNLSFTNSLAQKNKNAGNNSQIRKQMQDSWADNAPNFGNMNNMLMMGDDSQDQSHHHEMREESKNTKPQAAKFDLQKRPPSMEDIFSPAKAEHQEKATFDKQEKTPTALEKMIDGKNPPSMIAAQGNNDSSLFLQNSNSFVLPGLEDPFINAVDEYTDDDDAGYDLYEVSERDFPKVTKQLADKFGFPQRACQLDANKNSKNDRNNQKDAQQITNEEDSAVILRDLQDKKKDPKADDATYDKNKGNDSFSASQSEPGRKEEQKDKKHIHLPASIKYPPSHDNFYPVKYDNVIYDCFDLKVIFDRERTGFEETKDFPIVINSTIAGRYQILEYLGSAAFSKAIQCCDLVTNQMVCMKIIENNKDYYDQSIDEIKLLKYINFNANVDEKNVLRLYDYFYHKEHLFIVTELLKDNLYEFSKFNRENESELYFTVGRLQRITKQILSALDYIHSLNLIHCDLKPENILMKSYSRCEVKVIDFGSSCFIHDHLSSYVQSRSYRAPEVIIGCKYDYKIDMWSLGCILAELWTGNVLFQNETVQALLARVVGIIGPFPEKMMKEGRLVNNFFTKEKLLYQEAFEDGGEPSGGPSYPDQSEGGKKKSRTGKIQILVPKRSSLKHRLRTSDHLFLDFVRSLLEIDPAKRPTAKEAINHPWITEAKYPENDAYANL